MMIMSNLKRLQALAVCLVLLACICASSLAWTPQPSPTVAAPAVQPAPFPLAALPEAWGNPTRAARPALAKPQVKVSSALVPLPAPKSLPRMPIGRVQVGEGRVDPAETMRHQALYVIKAQTAGVVEYLYDTSGCARAGMPLVRLYDPNILSDLRIGESAMARFASSPFVIAGRQAGLPPVPPADFPKPTALQRLLGICPTPSPVVAAPAPVQRSQLAAEPFRGGLSRASGLTPQPLAPVTPERNVKPASVRAIARLSGEMSDLHDQMADLNKTLAGVDDDLGAVKDKLTEAKDDAAARERLYNQGVLARNVYEAAKAHLGLLNQQLDDLQTKRGEVVHARDLLLQRIATLQDQMDRQVAEKSKEAATLADRDEQRPAPAASTTAPSPNAAPGPRRIAAAPAPARQDWFPSPTARPRPELRHLPRLAGPRLRATAEIPSVPMEVKRLAAPRWVDQAAPSDGVVVRQLAPNGAQVQPGTPLLEVANREWARVYNDIAQSDVANFPKGAPVRISFDNYPGVTLEGWINDVEPLPSSNLARVEMMVVAREGYCQDDTYGSLEWLVLAAPIVTDDRPEAMQPAVSRQTVAECGFASIYNLLPLVPPELGPGQEQVQQVKNDEYVGLLRLGESDLRAAAAQENPEQAKRLDALRHWRDSFTAGMTTGIFGNLVLTYPRDNEVGQAVEKMATAQVTHVPDRCARTMREALGWGLGDAAVWMNRLPERGYKPRQDGLARPGDILVWPFTYGPNRSQHIGVAVSQAGRLMLLSNLGGTLGTTELQGGYVAFFKPGDKPALKLNVKAPLGTAVAARR